MTSYFACPDRSPGYGIFRDKTGTALSTPGWAGRHIPPHSWQTDSQMQDCGLFILNQPSLSNPCTPHKLSSPKTSLRFYTGSTSTSPGKKEVEKVCAHLCTGHKVGQFHGRTGMSSLGSWTGIRAKGSIQHRMRNKKKALSILLMKCHPLYLMSLGPVPQDLPFWALCVPTSWLYLKRQWHPADSFDRNTSNLDTSAMQSPPPWAYIP